MREAIWRILGVIWDLSVLATIHAGLIIIGVVALLIVVWFITEG